MKDSALSEPLVDTVELKALVTDPCAVFTIDLNTVTVADLAFSEPFQLRCQRNDFIHALIAWFDIDFTACHKPIRFSTGPHTKYTHWKQTVFYLREVLTVEEGEVVQGYLSNKPNNKNRRDLDVKIDYELDAAEKTRAARGSNDYKM
jgi:protein arginine N-methyltransferase 1